MMNCKHNLDDIISLTERVLSEEKKSEVIARIKECESCRKAYSILMATESYTLTQPSSVAGDISMKVLEKIDQSRYSKGKASINAYKLLHKIFPALKPLSALAAVVILAITVNWNMPLIKSWIKGLTVPRTEIADGSSKDRGQNKAGSQPSGEFPEDSLEDDLPQDDSKNDRALDLDGDGNAESIEFKAAADGNSFGLRINGITMEGSANNLQGSYSIVDIDSTDRYREIAIGELGPSSDEATYFYRFDGKEIILMGKIQGLAENMLIDGSGYISTSKRGNILHTWFYRADYRITADHQLEFIPNDQYVMNTKVKVLQPLTLQRSQTDPSPAFTLQTGEEAVIISSDDKEWCLVENSKGQQGWFAVENFFIIKGTGKAAPEFFEGLNFAD